MQITVGCDHTITAEKSTALAIAAAIMCSAMAQNASKRLATRIYLRERSRSRWAASRSWTITMQTGGRLRTERRLAVILAADIAIRA